MSGESPLDELERLLRAGRDGWAQSRGLKPAKGPSTLVARMFLNTRFYAEWYPEPRSFFGTWAEAWCRDDENRVVCTTFHVDSFHGPRRPEAKKIVEELRSEGFGVVVHPVGDSWLRSDVAILVEVWAPGESPTGESPRGDGT